MKGIHFNPSYYSLLRYFYNIVEQGIMRLLESTQVSKTLLSTSVRTVDTPVFFAKLVTLSICYIILHDDGNIEEQTSSKIQVLSEGA